MILRPVDASGDMCPVASSRDLLSGSEAVALLVKYRLSLLQGEWWENPALGFPVLEDLRSSRLTEEEAKMLSSVITAYIRNTPGVQSVENVNCIVTGRELNYSCEVLTKEGTTDVVFSAIY